MGRCRQARKPPDESIFFGKNITELDLEPVHHGFQFVQGQMKFAAFEPVQGGVGNSGLLGELGIRQFPPLFSQVFGQLSIKASSHP